MNEAVLLAAGTAAAIGFVHTLIGVDHYLPFVVLGRARGWSLRKTLLVTLGCGLGHVLSSVILGLVGIAAGVAVGHLEAIESARGEIAAWSLVTVGVVYAAWGLHRALRHRGHHHHGFPSTAELEAHEAAHEHGRAHRHHHGAAGELNMTPWVLFVVFALGPCEPLIPVLMYPAATSGIGAALAVAGVFGVATLAAMTLAVAVGRLGIDLLPLGQLERFSHALAGTAIVLSGLAIQFLGL